MNLREELQHSIENYKKVYARGYGFSGNLREK